MGDLKYVIDYNYPEEQIEYVRKTLERITNNLFTFYEVYEKDLYKKYNLDITQSYHYNYMEDRKKFWEKYKC